MPAQPQSTRSSHSNRSLSSSSFNFASHLQTSKRRLTVERPSDAEKFDTLLMLAAERTNHHETRRKRHLNEINNRRRSSTSPQRKDVPLLLVEQQGTNHVTYLRPQVRFSTNTGRD